VINRLGSSVSSVTPASNGGQHAHGTEIEYIVPAVVFGVLTAVEGYLPIEYYPAAYAIKAVAVTLALLWARRTLRDIVPAFNVVVPSVLVGIVVFVVWIYGEQWIPYPHMGSRSAYDPFSHLSPGAATAFLAVRLYGLILMVPVFEELLWRSFLIRYATSADFQTVPIGTYSMTALLIVCGAAALAHPEWLIAFIANAMYTLWLGRTRSVFATIVAHATTNAILGVYVLRTGNWQLW
jgi:CAAX prenyl protease-like protein